MNGYHWITLLIAVVAGIALQKYFNVTGKIGL